MEKSMKKNIIIVDDFYSDPDQVRKFALSVNYNTSEKQTNWPGKDSTEEYLSEELTMGISHIVNEPLRSVSQNKSHYFRITKEGEFGSQHIHFDPGSNLIWAGICYLTPTERPESGTKFWRHKQYGWESAPTEQEANPFGIYNSNDMKKFFETDGVDESKWTEVFNVPFKYNRLVLFRPWLFHCNGKSFGKTDETSRLIQLFFFHQM
jgi:hypothetical protein